MGRFIEIGERGFMGKEQDTLWVLGRELTISVPTVTTLMNQN
jgi:hypothetical protein